MSTGVRGIHEVIHRLCVRSVDVAVIAKAAQMLGDGFPYQTAFTHSTREESLTPKSWSSELG
ncbi:hypothetical protein GCM10022420_045120 [Streptomyces iranensis]